MAGIENPIVEFDFPDDESDVSEAESGFCDDETDNLSDSEFSGGEYQIREEIGFSELERGRSEKLLRRFCRASPALAKAMLKCRICSNICHPPLRACEDEHVICAYCLPRVHPKCTLCGCPHSNVRPFDLEMLHGFLDFKCHYQENGCDFQGSGYGIVSHINQCPFNSAGCSHISCNWTGKPYGLFEHYEKEHKDNFFGNYVVEVEFDRAQERLSNAFVWKVSDSECVFFSIKLIPFENKIHVIACNVGYVKSIEKYELRVKIRKKYGGTYDFSAKFGKFPNYLMHGVQTVKVIVIKCNPFEMLMFDTGSKEDKRINLDIDIKPPADIKIL